jgi:hypothetical protein
MKVRQFFEGVRLDWCDFIVHDAAFPLYLIITNVVEYNGWWSFPTLLKGCSRIKSMGGSEGSATKFVYLVGVM